MVRLRRIRRGFRSCKSSATDVLGSGCGSGCGGFAFDKWVERLKGLGFLQFVLQFRLSQIPLPSSCLKNTLQEINPDACKPSTLPFGEKMCEHFQDVLLDSLYRKRSEHKALNTNKLECPWTASGDTM